MGWCVGVTVTHHDTIFNSTNCCRSSSTLSDFVWAWTWSLQVVLLLQQQRLSKKRKVCDFLNVYVETSQVRNTVCLLCSSYINEKKSAENSLLRKTIAHPFLLLGFSFIVLSIRKMSTKFLGANYNRCWASGHQDYHPFIWCWFAVISLEMFAGFHQLGDTTHTFAQKLLLHL